MKGFKGLFETEGLVTRTGAKVWPVRSTLQFMRWFRNWPDVLSAYRHKTAMPPLVLRNGMTIEHDSADEPILIFREVFVGQCYTGDGFYSPRSTDVVIDIGANIGITALYLNWRAPGIRVHCFEPAAAARAKFGAQLTRNGLTQVVVHEEAVSDHLGSARLFSDTYSGHGSLYQDHMECSVHAVHETRLITLSDAIAMTEAHVVDLLKIDAEGSEVDILSANPVKDLAYVKRAVVEYHEAIRPGAFASVVDSLRTGGLVNQQVLPSGIDGRIGIIRAWR